MCFWRRSICLSFSSCGTFPIFWTFPMACSRMEMAAWKTPNCSASIFCDWVSSSSKRACNWQSSKQPFLGRFSHFLSLRSKLLSLNRRNQSLHVVSDKALSIGLHKHSMRFGSRFLQIEIEKQSFPRMLFFLAKKWLRTFFIISNIVNNKELFW